MAVYAKFEGIDGESQDGGHDKWIDVLSTDWGTNKPVLNPVTPLVIGVHRAPLG